MIIVVRVEYYTRNYVIFPIDETLCYATSFLNGHLLIIHLRRSQTPKTGNRHDFPDLFTLLFV